MKNNCGILKWLMIIILLLSVEQVLLAQCKETEGVNLYPNRRECDICCDTWSLLGRDYTMPKRANEPDNDGAVIYGYVSLYDQKVRAVLPYYNSKIFYCDSTGTTPEYSFFSYSSHFPNDNTYWRAQAQRVIMEPTNEKFDCSSISTNKPFKFKPVKEQIGTSVTINLILTATRSIEGHNFWKKYSQFSIYVVAPPKWKEVLNDPICETALLNLESYTENHDSAITYYINNNQVTKDASRNGTYANIKGLTQSTVYEFKISRKYDNGDVPYVDTKQVTILPGPPTVKSRDNIVLTKPCVGESNGTIVIQASDIKSNFSEIEWILRPATNKPCEIIGSDCGNGLKQSNGAIPISQGITITDIGNNQYSLELYNPGGTTGNCSTRYDNINMEPSALQTTLTNTHIACRGDTTGTIKAEAFGGDNAKGYNINLFIKKTEEDSVEVSAKKVESITSNSKTWHNLPAGDYTVKVKDNTCDNISDITKISLTQPDTVKATARLTHRTCANPANGTIQINITDAPEEITHFTYSLLKDNKETDNVLNTTAKSHDFKDQGAGSYHIKIMNANISECVLTTLPVILDSPPSLAQTLVSHSEVMCHGGNTGELEVSGSGGKSQGYLFNLQGMEKDLTNNDGKFSQLFAGDYKVILRNADDSCKDRDTVAYHILQKPQLAVPLTPLPITCHDTQDGAITAVPSGGTGTYKFQWERKDKDGNWQNYPNPVPDPPGKIENLAAGIYRIVIEDHEVEGCTVTSSEVDFTAPDPIRLDKKNVVVIQAVCQADGARIRATATGGYGDYIYSYSLDNWISQVDFTEHTHLTTTGNYRIKVSNRIRTLQAECSAESDSVYHVSVPATALNFTDSLSQYGVYNVKCSGGNNGEIIVRAEGGNGGEYTGYQYKIDTREYQPESILKEVTAGNHEVSVRDGRGCEVTRTINLTQPPALLYTGTKSDIDCAGASTGVIIPQTTGGTPQMTGIQPYEIKINNEVKTMGEEYPNLAVGDYHIRITDAAECTVDTVVSIGNKHPALTATAEGGDIKCAGEKGQAVVTPEGGDGHYTLQISSDNWNTHAIWENTQLEEGTYRFRVVDGLGCMAYAPNSVEITTPAEALSFTYTLSDYDGHHISCRGGSNGSATLMASGGNGGSYAGYTYAIDNGEFGNDPLLDNINAGTHTLRVKDGRGCEKTAEVNFTQSEDILSIESVSQENVLCANSASGVITVLGKWKGAESPDLKYRINDKPWQSSPTFSDLTVATHKVYVKDALECIMSMEVEITSTHPLIVVDHITHQDIVCLNDKANIQVIASGGTGALTPQYSRNGGEYISFTGTTPLEEGEYLVRVKDEADCYVAADTIQFTSPLEALTFSVVKSDYHGMSVSCHGLSNGSLTAQATGGNGGTYSGYTYSLDGGDFADTYNFPNLPGGIHNLRVKDGRGCISSQDPVLEQPEVLTFEWTSTEAPKCGADATGIIALKNAQGGTPPYQYSSDKEHWQDGTTFLSLPKGDYTIYVKDVNECMAEKNTTLEAQYPSLVATPDITHVKCFGQSTGAINPAVSGGHGSFTYKWSDNSTQAIIQNQPAGEYTLQVTDEVECTGNFKFAISQPPALTLQLEAPSICDTHSNGIITATATGGTAPYSFSLNNQASQEGNIFMDLTHETYSVTVEDAHICTTTSSTTIGKLNVKPEINFLVATRKNALDTLAIKEISIPEPDEVNWAFDPRIKLISEEDSSPLIKCEQAGSYWVEMSGKWRGCDYSVRKSITINPFDPLAGPGKKLPVNVFEEVSLSPNPTTGELHLSVILNRRQQLMVYVYSMTSHIIDKRQYDPRMSLEEDFTFSSEVSAGTYIMRIIAENDSRDIRFVLTR